MTEVAISKKRYPDELKVEAVKQVVDCGHSVADVAARFGMTTHFLYAWIRKLGPDSKEHIAKSDEQAEIRRLKKEPQRATRERDLLTKSLGVLRQSARLRYAFTKDNVGDPDI
jgi:transposase